MVTVGTRLDTGHPRASGGARSPLRTREFSATCAALLGILIAAFAVLRILEARHASLLLSDFRSWHPVSSVSDDAAAHFESLQADRSAERAFHAVVMFERIPQEGDFFGIERQFQVDGDGTYCFRVFAIAPYYNENPYALVAFRIVARINDREVVSFPIAENRDARVIDVTGIAPEGGNITITLGVLATATRFRPSWQQASRTEFEYAWFRRCS